MTHNKQGCPEVAKMGGGRFFGNFLKTFMKICWKNYQNFRKILENFWKFWKNLEKLSRF
jgi:hypothetical protein